LLTDQKVIPKATALGIIVFGVCIFATGINLLNITEFLKRGVKTYAFVHKAQKNTAIKSRYTRNFHNFAIGMNLA